MRIRKDVWSLTNTVGDWPQELVKYRQAVHAMRELDPPGNGKPTDPLSFLDRGIDALKLALRSPVFYTDDGQESFGGGQHNTPAHSGVELGLLEGVPHGMVHSLVGNDYDQFGRPVKVGWMGDFATAGLDPVFWLHHANIDRLWQVWLDVDASHTNPTGDNAWMRTKFKFPKPGGGHSSGRSATFWTPSLWATSMKVSRHPPVFGYRNRRTRRRWRRRLGPRGWRAGPTGSAASYRRDRRRADGRGSARRRVIVRAGRHRAS